MIRIKQEPLSPPPAFSLPPAVTPPPPPPHIPETISASTAADVASFLVSTAAHISDDDDPPLRAVLQEEKAQAGESARQALDAVDVEEDEDEGECERIPEEDQLDPDDPSVHLMSMCAERLARIRLHWAQELRSIHVKQEVEAQVAQQVLAAYDDLYDETNRGADDSEGSEDGHGAWCEEEDWGGGPDPSEQSDDSQTDGEEDWWDEEGEGVDEKRSEADMREYREWKAAQGLDAIDSFQHEHKYDEDDDDRQGLQPRGAVRMRDEVSDASGSNTNETQQRVRRETFRNTPQPRATQHDHPNNRASHQPQQERAGQPSSTDISDILNECPTISSSKRGPGYVWQVFEDGSEGWMYDRAKEEEWIREEMSRGGIADIASQSQSPRAGAQTTQAAAVADDRDAEMEEQEDASESDLEQEAMPASSDARRGERYQSQLERRRSADRVEQRKTVRRETSTIRKTHVTTTKTTKYVWEDNKEDSDSSASQFQQSRSKQRRGRGKNNRRARGNGRESDKLETRECSPGAEEDVKPSKRKVAKPLAGKRKVAKLVSHTEDDTDAVETNRLVIDGAEQDTCVEEAGLDLTDGEVCIECGELVPTDNCSSFCSPLCEQWVGHKRFVSDFHRSMCSTWRQQHDHYYQPMHNLPRYPVITTELTFCQLPLAALATESLDSRSLTVRAYLNYQLALYPATRLSPSRIHGIGVFTTKAVSTNSRLLPIFGVLYPRDRLLDDRDRLLPAARGMDRLLDVDALSVEDVTVVMSISRACVAGYINSVRGTGRQRNVRFECDERVDKQQWRGEGWVPSGLMVVTAVRDIKAGEELLENYPVG